jgi:hypothetical protein
MARRRKRNYRNDIVMGAFILTVGIAWRPIHGFFVPFFGNDLAVWVSLVIIVALTIIVVKVRDYIFSL